MRCEGVGHAGERTRQGAVPLGSGRGQVNTLPQRSMGGESELRRLPFWGAHQLKGDRKGTWSFHVTGNWRLTFSIAEDELHNINLEDYH